MAGLIIDNFAGGGGASTGIEAALGRSIDVAINHDAEAVAMHAANHPNTHHLCQNVWKADPRDVVRQASLRRGSKVDLPVDLAWFSPDCTHFSKAKGSKPVKKGTRDLAWVVVHWAKLVKPKVIALENVEEFRDWGPLIETEDGKMMPCPLRKGVTFKRWRRELEKLGYKVDVRELRACDFGAPTIRKRLFVIARCDGLPIVWPEPSHAKQGAGGLKPWRSAASCIDWSLPCPSIFMTRDDARELYRLTGIRVQRPLADNTLARIGKGVWRYVIGAAEPFIVPINHAGDTRVHSLHDPMRTITAANRGEHALITPFVTKFRKGSTGHRIDEPLHTITANSYIKRPGGAAPLGIVTPFLVPRYLEREGQEPRTRRVTEPMATIVPGGNEGMLVSPVLVGCGGRAGQSPPRSVEDPTNTATRKEDVCLVSAFLAQHNYMEPGHDVRDPLSTIVAKVGPQAVVSAGLVNLKGSDRRGAAIDGPVPTITAQGGHLAEVRAFLIKYYSTGGQWQSCHDPLHTITVEDRIGVVMVQGEAYRIADIGMRMLTARERFNAQSFPTTYIIDVMIDGKKITGEAQGSCVGNSVPPAVAEAIVRANVANDDDLPEVRAAD